MRESPADRLDEDVRFHEWEAIYLDSWRCTEPVGVRYVVDRGSPSLATADFDDERLRLAKRLTPMGERAGEPTELRRTRVGEVDVDRSNGKSPALLRSMSAVVICVSTFPVGS